MARRNPLRQPWRRLGLVGLVSGGQTGVDRAVLDLALEAGIPCGGWCPKGRWAEDGPLDERYPLHETPLVRVVQRTLWNMRDSDATLVLAQRRPRGGSAILAAQAGINRPRLVVDPGATGSPRRVAAWLCRHQVRLLNVGGPRASEDAEIYDLARDFLVRLLLAPVSGPR
ncbi:MAG: putative molybdenum carrier protein [Alphaproteobacteria bacterium]|nr:molybdenum cofactor carrier [Rhodospirillaceae bacterium]MDP6403786.1 putative molybdenum carrier protein [Alphaproteobacteria bacterium]MDP6620637.1 putative molybdenum carrier protein [Alphaproteobacteria bacterium]